MDDDDGNSSYNASLTPGTHFPPLDQQISELDKAKKFTIYRNGDPLFMGKEFVLNRRRFRTWDSFLEGVTDNLHCQTAVRSIRTPTNGSPVYSLDQLENHHAYVACSAGPFAPLPYLDLDKKVSRIRPPITPKDFLYVNPVTHNRYYSRLSPRYSKVPIDVIFIFIHTNGKDLQPPRRLIITHTVRDTYDWISMLNLITTRCDLTTGSCHKLYDMNYRRILDVCQFRNNHHYIAVGKEGLQKINYMLYQDLHDSRIQKLRKRRGVSDVPTYEISRRKTRSGDGLRRCQEMYDANFCQFKSDSVRSKSRGEEYDQQSPRGGKVNFQYFRGDSPDAHGRRGESSGRPTTGRSTGRRTDSRDDEEGDDMYRNQSPPNDSSRQRYSSRGRGRGQGRNESDYRSRTETPPDDSPTSRQRYSSKGPAQRSDNRSRTPPGNARQRYPARDESRGRDDRGPYGSSSPPETRTPPDNARQKYSSRDGGRRRNDSPDESHTPPDNARQKYSSRDEGRRRNDRDPYESPSPPESRSPSRRRSPDRRGGPRRRDSYEDSRDDDSLSTYDRTRSRDRGRKSDYNPRRQDRNSYYRGAVLSTKVSTADSVASVTVLRIGSFLNDELARDRSYKSKGKRRRDRSSSVESGSEPGTSRAVLYGKPPVVYSNNGNRVNLPAIKGRPDSRVRRGDSFYPDIEVAVGGYYEQYDQDGDFSRNGPRTILKSYNAAEIRTTDTYRHDDGGSRFSYDDDEDMDSEERDSYGKKKGPSDNYYISGRAKERETFHDEVKGNYLPQESKPPYAHSHVSTRGSQTQSTSFRGGQRPAEVFKDDSGGPLSRESGFDDDDDRYDQYYNGGNDTGFTRTARLIPSGSGVSKPSASGASKTSARLSKPGAVSGAKPRPDQRQNPSRNNSARSPAFQAARQPYKTKQLPIKDDFGDRSESPSYDFYEDDRQSGIGYRISHPAARADSSGASAYARNTSNPVANRDVGGRGKRNLSFEVSPRRRADYVRNDIKTSVDAELDDFSYDIKIKQSYSREDSPQRRSDSPRKESKERQSPTKDRQSPTKDRQSPTNDWQSPTKDRQSPTKDRQSPVKNRSNEKQQRDGFKGRGRNGRGSHDSVHSQDDTFGDMQAPMESFPTEGNKDKEGVVKVRPVRIEVRKSRESSETDKDSGSRQGSPGLGRTSETSREGSRVGSRESIGRKSTGSDDFGANIRGIEAATNLQGNQNSSQESLSKRGKQDKNPGKSGSAQKANPTVPDDRFEDNLRMRTLKNQTLKKHGQNKPPSEKGSGSSHGSKHSSAHMIKLDQKNLDEAPAEEEVEDLPNNATGRSKPEDELEQQGSKTSVRSKEDRDSKQQNTKDKRQSSLKKESKKKKDSKSNKEQGETGENKLGGSDSLDSQGSKNGRKQKKTKDDPQSKESSKKKSKEDEDDEAVSREKRPRAVSFTNMDDEDLLDINSDEEEEPNRKTKSQPDANKKDKPRKGAKAEEIETAPPDVKALGKKGKKAENKTSKDEADKNVKKKIEETGKVKTEKKLSDKTAKGDKQPKPQAVTISKPTEKKDSQEKESKIPEKKTHIKKGDKHQKSRAKDGDPKTTDKEEPEEKETKRPDKKSGSKKGGEPSKNDEQDEEPEETEKEEEPEEKPPTMPDKKSKKREKSRKNKKRDAPDTEAEDEAEPEERETEQKSRGKKLEEPAPIEVADSDEEEEEPEKKPKSKKAKRGRETEQKSAGKKSEEPAPIEVADSDEEEEEPEKKPKSKKAKRGKHRHHKKQALTEKKSTVSFKASRPSKTDESRGSETRKGRAGIVIGQMPPVEEKKSTGSFKQSPSRVTDSRASSKAGRSSRGAVSHGRHSKSSSKATHVSSKTLAQYKSETSKIIGAGFNYYYSSSSSSSTESSSSSTSTSSSSSGYRKNNLDSSDSDSSDSSSSESSD